MKNTSFFLVLVALFFSLQSFGKILVISDIDDTLKISHVLMTYDTIDNSIAYDNHFIGMSQVLQAVGKSNDAEFAYVSNAPRSVMLIPHEMFLDYNQFPLGTLYLRPSIFDSNHKLETITDIILKSEANFVLLIGDNGEADPVIYRDLVQRFPAIRFHVYIHQVYSVLSKSETGQKLEAGQKGFATSIDLAADLQALGLLAVSDFEQISAKVIPAILSQDMTAYYGEIAFPDWMDCRDFLSQKTQSLLVSVQPLQVQSLIERYEEKLKARCSTPSPWSYD